MSNKYLYVVTLLGLTMNPAASADVLVLKNGDQITGEISRIWDSEVTIEPDYADEFSVDIEAIEYIKSDRQFEIELNDGREVIATLAGGDEQGRQVLDTEDEPVAVALQDLFELDEPEEDFDWSSNIELSATLNSGNTDSFNSKVRADGLVRKNDHRHLGELTFSKEETDGVVSQDQDRFQYDYNWLFRDPWFFSTQFTFERDPIIDLQSRYILSAGIGRDIWNTPRRFLSMQLGAGGQEEEIAQASESSAVLTWSLRYRQDFIGDSLELYHNHFISHNVSGRENTVFRTTTGLRYEITDLLYANLSMDYDYETDPADIATNEDIAILFGLGAEFE
jgi:putative salt-induced outer membrane protein YdiY